MKIAATQNLASYENDYLDVADHFWRGVEEGILPFLVRGAMERREEEFLEGSEKRSSLRKIWRVSKSALTISYGHIILLRVVA